MRLYNEIRHQASQNFAILLLAQVLFILMPAIFYYLKISWLPIVLLTLVIFSSIYIITNTKRDLLVGNALGLVAIASLWADEGTTGDIFSIGGHIFSMLFFLFAAIKLWYHIARCEKIDLNILMAAVSGYLFIGIIGGHIVRLVDLTNPGSFTQSMSEAYTNIYFSFVTITTLGFGDISPVTPTGQAVTIILAITGQLYLTIIIAVIISRMLTSK